MQSSGAVASRSTLPTAQRSSASGPGLGGGDRERRECTGATGSERSERPCGRSKPQGHINLLEKY